MCSLILPSASLLLHGRSPFPPPPPPPTPNPTPHPPLPRAPTPLGEYASAKSHYQQALDACTVSMGAQSPELEAGCKAGIARTTLQLGDLRQGRQLALQLNSQPLYKECALILEGLQQLTVREGGGLVGGG